jgi:hypothetical protein
VLMLAGRSSLVSYQLCSVLKHHMMRTFDDGQRHMVIISSVPG